MSSLRLALKQSLENSILTSTNKSSKGKSLYQHPSATSTFGLSDKELRRRQRLESKAASDEDDDDSDDDDDDDNDNDSSLRDARKAEKKKQKKKKKGGKKKKSNNRGEGGRGDGKRKLKKDHRRRRENKDLRREELRRRITADGGTEIRVGGEEGGKVGGGYRGSSKNIYPRVDDDDESMSGSSLSSSSSGSSSSTSSDSSSDSDSDSDSSSTSSSSSSSDSSASTTDDDNNDDDDDGSSSDDGSSTNASGNKGKGKARRGRGDKYSSDDDGGDDDDDGGGSLNSSSDSDDTIMVADRESKMLFDADLSSSGGSENENERGDGDGRRSVEDDDDDNDDDERRRRRMKKKTKMLKRAAEKRAKKRKKDDAANTIQNHWKSKNKKKKGGVYGGEEDDDDGPASPVGGVAPFPPPTVATSSSRSSSYGKVGGGGGGGSEDGGGKGGTDAGKSTTVESPSPEVLRHIRSMSTKSQRREVHPGLRVKVRFVKRANVNGRATRKLKWYGGVVYGVSNGGRRIKVHYDDGTNEASDFPDKDIIIDDRNNGRHVFGGGSGGDGGGRGGGSRGGGGGREGGGVVGSAFAPPPPRRTPATTTDGDDDASSDDDNDEERERGGGDEIIIAARKRSNSQSGGGGAVFADGAGGNETRKLKKKKKNKKKKRERLAAAEGEGDGGRPTSPYDKIDVGREEASSFDATKGGREGGGGGDVENEDASVIDFNNKKKKKKKKKATSTLLSKVSVKDKRRDSLSDMSIGSTDGEVTEIMNVHGKRSSDEEGEEKDGENVKSKSSPYRLEGTDSGDNENEEDISRAQSNRCPPTIEEGELSESGGLQSKEMREGGHHAVKRESTAHLKYTNKPQDEGLSDEAYTKSNQAAVANASDPPNAANRPQNAARLSSSSSGMDVADTVVVHPSSTTENEKTIGTADALVNVKLPPHAGVDELSSKHQPQQVKAIQEEQDETISTTGKEESKKENISAPGTAAGGADIPPPPPAAATAAAMTANAEEHAQHHPQTVLTTQPLELKKKRGPLSIRIGLPGAKRKKQMEEEMKLKQQVQSAADGASPETTSSFIIEPSKKKQKISTRVLGDNERIGDDSINEEVMKDSDTSLSAPARSLDTISSKGKESYDNSLSDGEIQEDGDIDEDDAAGDMKKTSETIHEDTPKMESSPPAPKKPKLVIKLNTKKRKQQQESKADEEAAPFVVGDNEFQQNADRVEFSNAAMEIVPPPERLKEAAADSIVDDRNRAVGAISPRSDDDRSKNDKTPNSTGTSASTSPVPPESGSAADDGNAYSMARSGRKAAKRAAEKIAVKKHKPKKEEKHKKAEEDPWVQCDRCHKWRHLPGTVNIDSLPENWFCELNIYDPKRNNCEADEQTSKEVAKEKKRAKKLAIMKLQFEHAQAVAEEVQEETKPKNKMGGRSTSPKNDSDKETEFVVPDEKSALMDSIDAKGKSITDVDDDADTTPPFKSKAKRGRPRRDDKEKHDKNKDEPVDEPKKQEWVQCEKCEKWRRLPPRISAEDLPDVWYCSMNTWDIHLATCTAIEDKHEASPARTAQYSEQSQIPTSFASSSKLSYRNLIFGSGRRQKNISERMRAQESLFSTQEQNDADMGMPPTVAYANSKVFFNKNLHKTNSFDDEGVPPPTSIFDILSYSRVWQELNNNASTFHARNIAHTNG